MAPRKKEENTTSATAEDAFITADKIAVRGIMIPTGVSTIDSTMPFTTGVLIGLFGVPGSGKTRLSYTLAVSAVTNKIGDAMIIDYEGSFSRDLVLKIAKKFGADDSVLTHIYIPKRDVITGPNWQQFFTSIPYFVEMYAQRGVRVVVIDSVGVLRQLMPGRENLVTRQQLLSQMLGGLRRVVMRYDVLAVVTTHVMYRPDMIGQMTYIGGAVLGHSVELFMIKRSDGDNRVLVPYEVSYLPNDIVATFSICEQGICEPGR